MRKCRSRGDSSVPFGIQRASTSYATHGSSCDYTVCFSQLALATRVVWGLWPRALLFLVLGTNAARCSQTPTQPGRQATMAGASRRPVLIPFCYKSCRALFSFAWWQCSSWLPLSAISLHVGAVGLCEAAQSPSPSFSPLACSPSAAVLAVTS